MPYFITDKSPDCSGWATIKEDGEVIGCHTTKQDAIDQMVAVSIAEDMEPGGERNENAEEVVIVDIDGTLIVGNQGIKKNVDYVNKLYEDYYIYIVTGRPESDEEKTLKQLADAGVRFDDIEFNEDLSVSTAVYKKEKAREILKERSVKLAIDNDAAARRAYSDLGISTMDPKTIETVAERAPAPPSDQITGSDKNPAGSAAGKQGGIEINEATETALRNKATDHNEKMDAENRPVWTRVTLGVLKSVYRRGAGAYSTSHRPGIGRAQWAMARVNAFLYLSRAGRPENPAYITDNDLLHVDHPKYSAADRALPDNYRPALSPDVPEGRACGNCAFYDESNVQGEGDDLKAWCEKWDEYVDGGFYCNAWQPHEEENEEDRQVSLEIPVYIRTAARKGLDYYGQGLAGEGLVDRTVREARDMARGNITEDKVIRANAWAQRHAVDLQAPKNSDASNDQFPGAGAVAHYLWGINPLNPQPARDWFERKANAIKDERGLFNFHRAKSEYFANIPGMEDNKVETRRINVNEFELRAGPTGDGMSFTGYAAVFNSDSEPLPFIERIVPGAFRKSLKGRNTIKMYMNHDSSMLLASTRSKTLRLEEDSRGLLVNADLPDTTVGRDLSVLMQRGDVDSMSFGFSVPAGGDKWSDDGMTRELRQVRLHEVSVVTGFPAYKATSASVRSLDMLAERTGVDADKLAEAITMLESGNTLSDESADLLSSAVSKLRAEPAKVPASINLLAKKLELLKNF
jgi:HK97 family phage prohead protease